jgi:hypothetical protein
MTTKPTLQSIHMELQALKRQVEELNKKLSHHEDLLIRGMHDQLPLVEIVRNLARTVDMYISRKNEEEKQDAETRDKLRWIIIGVLVPAFLAFVGQAIVFYIRVLPTLERLAE